MTQIGVSIIGVFHTQSSQKFVRLPDITGKNPVGPVNITASQDRLSDEIFEPKI